MKNIILSVLVAIVFCGCQTAGKTLAATAVTVDSAMRAWAIYVVDGHATPEQENKVRDVYHKYQLAMQASRDAYSAAAVLKDESIYKRTYVGLNAAKEDIVALIKEFTTKKGVQ